MWDGIRVQVIAGLLLLLIGAIAGGVWTYVNTAVSSSFLKKGMVISFAASSCPPEPWERYEPAYGRFIRGLDPSGKTDPDGMRTVGGQQSDGIANHVHKLGVGTADTLQNTGGGRYADFDLRPMGSGLKETGSNDGSISETRPKNVALLYCILK